MKHLIISIAIAASTLISCSQNHNSTDTLRIMSYNVRNCKGMDLKLDYDRCADVINRAQPDIVAVQELDSMTSRYEGYYALGELATRTKMHDYYAPSIKYKGGKHGIGILSQEPAISLKQYPLPCRKEPRTMLVAEFDKFYFICTHLSLIGEDQVESARIINDITKQLNKPFILAGDLNATPESETMQSFFEFCRPLSDTTQLTIPADVPKRCIDYILTNSERIEGTNATVIEEPTASDHRPLYVDTTF